MIGVNFPATLTNRYANILHHFRIFFHEVVKNYFFPDGFHCDPNHLYRRKPPAAQRLPTPFSAPSAFSAAKSAFPHQSDEINSPPTLNASRR